MCQQKSTPPKKKGKQKSTVSLKPSRKTRTKRRKPKYLSLSLKLSPQKNPQSSNKKIKMTQKKKQQQLQLNLFPLHPELNLAEDHNKDMHEDNNVVASFLFDTATDSTTTLDDLLTTTNTTATTTSEDGPRSPPSLTYSYTRGRDNSYGGDSNGLVRTAMRCKERDASEERWVSYSEVVESNKIKEEEEESSCVDDADDDAGAWCVKQVQKRRLLLDLKLDYQEVMNAWSDKGPLYVDGEYPQTVPDLRDPNIPIDAWSLWSVPEMTSNVGSLKVDDELGCKEGWKRSEHREASVLRYKEKRQNRLFSKRIRYEVRKLNAEKRPRMKGRFVKRSSDECINFCT